MQASWDRASKHKSMHTYRVQLCANTLRMVYQQYSEALPLRHMRIWRRWLLLVLCPAHDNSLICYKITFNPEYMAAEHLVHSVFYYLWCYMGEKAWSSEEASVAGAGKHLQTWTGHALGLLWITMTLFMSGSLALTPDNVSVLDIAQGGPW